MDAAVVHQVGLDDVMAVGLEYLRHGVAQQVVADMPQVQGFVGIGRRIFDHDRAPGGRGLPEIGIGSDLVKTRRPESAVEHEVQKTLDDIERLDFGDVGRHITADLGRSGFGRLAASSQQRENDQRIIAVELLACLLNLQLLLPQRPVERLDRAAHRLRNKVIDIHFPLMIC